LRDIARDGQERSSRLEDALIRRRGEMLEAHVDGELVALDVEKGTCYGFNRTATRIWQLLDEPRTVAALRDALLDEFEVDRDRCEAELLEALERMCRDGIVESSAPLGAAAPARA
jgi:Coenzyme PQQ synthesis protein D (PqqD)